MSLGPVMLDVADVALEADERELLRHPSVGGVILFARNYASPEQVRRLVAEIHSLREPRLLVAVDQEGGRVQRFGAPFSPLPAAGRLGELHDVDPVKALRSAEELGWLSAVELRAVGVDLNFAPVLDLRSGEIGAIGDRAFHRDPQVVAELAKRYMRGAREAGMAAVGKHFPGHGSVKDDSHLTLPTDERELETVLQTDLLSFERMIHYGLPALMSAHLLFPSVDSSPATFSRFWLTELLRERLGFEGALFSDDLLMAGAALESSVLRRAEAALAAGCDMVLVCNDPVAAAEVVDGLPSAPNAVASSRLAPLHGRGGARWEELADGERYRRVRETLTRLEPEPELGLGPRSI